MQMPSGSWHSNSYASASEKTRPRVRRARTEEGSRCLLSQDPVSLFRFLSLSLSPSFPLSLPFSLSLFLLASDGAGRDSLLLCALHLPSALVLPRAFAYACVRACVRARTRNCVRRNERKKDREEEKERMSRTPPQHAGLHAGGESIDVRCILPLLVPPQPLFTRFRLPPFCH